MYSYALWTSVHIFRAFPLDRLATYGINVVYADMRTGINIPEWVSRG